MTAQVSALPGFLNVIGYGGDDISFTATLKNKDTGAAIPIVGTSKAQIRRYKDDTEYWSMTVAVDPIITNKAVLTIPAAVSAAVEEYACLRSLYVGDDLVTGPMFQGFWDWQVVGGSTKTYASGQMTIIMEVSR